MGTWYRANWQMACYYTWELYTPDPGIPAWARIPFGWRMQGGARLRGHRSPGICSIVDEKLSPVGIPVETVSAQLANRYDGADQSLGDAAVRELQALARG
eukprot:gene10884-biopygen6549